MTEMARQNARVAAWRGRGIEFNEIGDGTDRAFCQVCPDRRVLYWTRIAQAAWPPLAGRLR